MKKKIIALLILIALMVPFVSGCNLIRENKERKANEILATVSSDGITLDITRNEYLAYANYMVSQYSQYGSTPDLKTLMPEIMDYMINQKYLIIKAMVYLKKIPERKDCMASNIAGISENTPEGVLTFAERYRAIKEANEGFQKDIDKYLAEYEQEKKNMDISKAKEDIDVYLKKGYSVSEVNIAEGSFKAEYLKNEKADNSKVKLVIVLMKTGEDNVEIIMPVNDSMYDEDSKFSTELSQEEESQKVVEKQVVLVYEEPITVDGEIDYRKHTTSPYKYRVVVPRGTEKKEEKISVDVGEIADRYKLLNEISDENKAEYFDYNLSTTPAIKEAYRQFRQAKKDMLINFETAGLNYYYKNQFENAILEALRHEISKSTDVSKITDKYVEDEYKILFNRQKEEYDILGTDKAKLDKFVSSLAEGSVNLEKIYYVPTEAIANEGYDLKEFFAIAHILFKFDDEQSQFIKDEKGDRDAIDLKELRWLAAQSIKTSRSNPNYDPDYEGECEDYDGEGICPKLAFDPEYLEESLFQGNNNIYDVISTAMKTAAPEDRLRLFKDYMALYNDDGGAIQSHTGYLITPKGISHSYDGDDFPSLAWELFKENPEVGSSFIKDGEELVLGYSFTSYGLHLMTISFMPFADGTVSAEGMFDVDAAIDSKGTTHKELIAQKLAQELRNKEYTKFTKEKEPSATDFSINQKKVDKLLKDIGIK